MNLERARAQIEAAVRQVAASGVAVEVMRHRFTAGDFGTVTLIDRIVAEALS